MRANIIISLMLVLPLAAFTACNDNDDDNTNNYGGNGGLTNTGGRSTGGSTATGGGTSAGGRAGTGTGGGTGGTSTGGTSGGTSSGTSGGTSSAGTTNTGGAATGGASGGSGGRGGASGGGAGGAGAGGSAGRAGGGGGAGRAGSAGTAGTGAAGMAGEGGEGGEGGAGGTGGLESMLNDSQIVLVVQTVNTSEIAAAQAALPLIQDPMVQMFAQMMITDHTTANMQTLALVSTNDIAPLQSATSRRLQNESTAVLMALSQATPTTTDRVYMESQVASHQETLMLMDSVLLPSAMSPALRALLTSLRATVAMHLPEAQSILTML